MTEKKSGCAAFLDPRRNALGCFGVLAALWLITVLFGGDDDSSTNSPPLPPPSPPPLHHLASPNAICRAAIGTIMGQDPAIITTEQEDGFIALSYRRPLDDKLWQYRCRLEDDRAMWAMRTGRWRNHPDDPKVFFKLTEKGDDIRVTIRIPYLDGSATVESYFLDELEAE